jgi:molybdenum-dependent DNA-binding transcriptional regulator ModE
VANTTQKKWNNARMDQLRALRVFTQVIADGSFAGAARTLDLAPTVVTRSMADLEEHLGARLLNRTTRSLALTEIGEVYLERARQLLADLDDADAVDLERSIPVLVWNWPPPAQCKLPMKTLMSRFCRSVSNRCKGIL